MKRFTTWLFFWLAVSPSARAQTGYTPETDLAEPRVQWDYGVFGSPSAGPFRLEVYYKIFNNGLTYRKDNGSYVAQYQIEVLLYRDDDQVAGTTFEEKYTVESFPRTLSITDFLVNQIGISVEQPGEFDLIVRLRDVHSDEVSQSEFHIDMPRWHDGWSWSSLEFARMLEPARDTSQFHKPGWMVIPSVSRSYGGADGLLCPVYLEIYASGDGADVPVQLAFTAHDVLGEQVLDTTVRTRTKGPTTAIVVELPVENLSPGEYRLTSRLRPEGGVRDVLVTEDRFSISWSLSTLLRTDFATAVEQLRYLASDAERESLLALPDSLRRPGWQAFWDRRDPTPGTPVNEVRDEYYRRIRYANSTFTVGQRPGWRTDRGRIYIEYGEPDEVERHPFDLEGYPYKEPWQLWRYYSRNLEFVFVDRRGSGDYELQYPYDGEYWRRN